IGFDDMTAAEEKYFGLQLDLARDLDMLVLIHTPHRNKKAGTSRSMDLCEEHGLDPTKVIVDHNNEETAAEVPDRGFWAACTPLPHTKMGDERMAEIVKRYASDRFFPARAADWGSSDPSAVPETARLMAKRGSSEAAIPAVTFDNALAAYSQSGQMRA